MLESFPLIGPMLAESIMYHYGSLYNFVLNVEHIDEVKDVGPKIKEIVLKILHHKWETT